MWNKPLLLDNVTDADVAKLAAFNEEYAREVEEIGHAAAKEIIPILARMADRLAQKKASRRTCWLTSSKA